jgi:hypothetical protein
VPATPDPDLALRLAKEVSEVYGQAVDELLSIVARRLARGIDQPGWAERKLMELVQLRNEAQAVLERLEVLGPEAAQRAIDTAWVAGGADAAADLGLTGTLASRTHTRAVEALARETVDSLRASHLQILRRTTDAYRTVISQTAAPGVVTGSLTRRQAAQRALDRFADQGITGFVDRAGRRWQLDSYAEMATRTAVGRAQVAGTLDRFTEAGRDLVIVSDAPQECSLCRPWEGRILSITGATAGYPSVSAATSSGLLHANCRHSLSAYVPGLTRPMEHTADPEGDVARQEQRRLERGIRQWRRREAVAVDDRSRQVARAHRLEWEGKLSRHVQTNDLKRLRYRERPAGPNLEPPFRARPSRAPIAPRPTRPTRPTGSNPVTLVEPSRVISSRPAPGRSDVGRSVDNALGRIGRLHRVPDTLAHLPVRASDAQSYFGAYHFTPTSPGHIDVARHGDHKALTFAHEFGHYLDHQLLSGSAGTWGSASDAPAMAGWRDAIDRSAATKALQGMPSDRLSRYYLRRDEQWARSYAQWVAVRSGDTEMIDEAAAITKVVGARGHSQWAEADFKEIASAIDEIFRTRGLLT